MDATFTNLAPLVDVLFNHAGVSEKVRTIEVIHRGGNNQLYRINCLGQSYVLKKYFEHPDDRRDRLEAEYTFLKIAIERAPGETPKPLAKSKPDGVALYEFVEGVPVTHASEVTPTHIKQAADFIAKLNRVGSEGVTLDTLPASEACFSIETHIRRVDDRLDELSGVRNTDVSNRDFNVFMGKLLARWRLIKAHIMKACRYDQLLDFTAELAPSARILSPSDFGFHNALIRNDGSAVFLDFEYAGWDDPAKLIGDFFSQVAIPIDVDYFKVFVETAFSGREDYITLYKRANLLLAVYKIKWCCIVLNVFLAKHLARRKFADSAINITEIKHYQLIKATKILQNADL
jgi:hypothetical protein